MPSRCHAAEMLLTLCGTGARILLVGRAVLTTACCWLVGLSRACRQQGLREPKASWACGDALGNWWV